MCPLFIKKCIICYVLLISYFASCFAQKNAIEIYRGIMISKPPFAAFVNGSYTGDPNYDKFKLSEPMFSSFWQFSYHRNFTKRWKIGLQFRELREGTRSTFQLPKPNSIFGGTAVYGNIFTFEIGLSVGHVRQINKLLSWEFGISPSIAMVEYFQRRFEYVHTGLAAAISSGNWRGAGNNVATGNKVNRYFGLLKTGSFKGSGYIFAKLHIETKYKWLSFQTTGEFGGSTNLLSRDPKGIKLVIPYTKGLKGMVHFGTSIKF